MTYFLQISNNIYLTKSLQSTFIDGNKSCVNRALIQIILFLFMTTDFHGKQNMDIASTH